MIPWHERTLVAFDTETTSTDPETARIVTAAVVTVDIPVGKTRKDELVINPGIEIPAEATEVHGITTEYAATYGTPARDAVRVLAAQLADTARNGWPIVVFNAPYDLTLLDRECRRYELPTLSEMVETDGSHLYVVDPLVIDREMERYRKGKKTLDACCKANKIVLPEAEAHTAAGDALAAARLAWKQAKRFREVGGIGLAELQQRQATWHAAWALNFESYLRTQGKHEQIDQSWPIRHTPAVTS